VRWEEVETMFVKVRVDWTQMKWILWMPWTRPIPRDPTLGLGGLGGCSSMGAVGRVAPFQTRHFIALSFDSALRNGFPLWRCGCGAQSSGTEGFLAHVGWYATKISAPKCSP